MDIDRLKSLSGIRESGEIYELVGITDEAEYGYGGYTGETNTDERVVATFDSEEAAKAYVDRAMLRSKRSGRYDNKFRNNSVLAGCTGYEIRPKENTSVPHNPE
jgi:hypothetical protein